MKNICFILLLCVPAFLQAQTKWEKAKEKDGILIYTRTNQNLKEFKAHMNLDARLETVVALLTDTKHFPKWVYKVESCEVIKEQLPQSFITYYTVAMPWPLKDRDGVTGGVVTQKADGSVVIHQTDQPDEVPEKDGYVRLGKVNTTWTVQPGEAGQVQLVYQSMADPGGLPNWLVNLFLLDGPMETLKGLRDESDNPAYANIEVSWLK
ncbi:MAG: START domain-containing protein [Bacteroidota bacterium]